MQESFSALGEGARRRAFSIVRTTRGRRSSAAGACRRCLLGGNHAEIRKWRRRGALEKTGSAGLLEPRPPPGSGVPDPTQRKLRSRSGEERLEEGSSPMISPYLSKVINKNKRTDLPEFRLGDTIRVHVKIKEGDKERLQAFEGTVIARKNSGMGETITVRKISFGQGVERIFPINAPVIDHIDVVRTGKVRRAKLYYLRGLKARPPASKNGR